jgi:hypothetical protein
MSSGVSALCRFLAVAELTPMMSTEGPIGSTTYYPISLTCPPGRSGELEYRARQRSGKSSLLRVTFVDAKPIFATLDLGKSPDKLERIYDSNSLGKSEEETEALKKTKLFYQGSSLMESVCLSSNDARRRYETILDINRGILEGRIKED